MIQRTHVRAVRFVAIAVLSAACTDLLGIHNLFDDSSVGGDGSIEPLDGAATDRGVPLDTGREVEEPNEGAATQFDAAIDVSVDASDAAHMSMLDAAIDGADAAVAVQVADASSGADAGQLCDGGACACPSVANPDACGSICTNKQSDPQNCGVCNNACTGGTVCVSGGCQCIGGTHLCSGACVANDVTACGPGCTPCAAGQGCFAGTCGCISGAGCPGTQACNTSTHTCSTSCDGITSICNGGCCSNGTCQPGNVIGACGAGGLQCTATCQLSGCVILPAWGGGGCECANHDDSFCTGVPTGQRCVPAAPANGTECGCLSDADCPSGSCNLVNVTYGYCL